MGGTWDSVNDLELRKSLQSSHNLAIWTLVLNIIVSGCSTGLYYVFNGIWAAFALWCLQIILTVLVFMRSRTYKTEPAYLNYIAISLSALCFIFSLVSGALATSAVTLIIMTLYEGWDQLYASWVLGGVILPILAGLNLVASSLQCWFLSKKCKEMAGQGGRNKVSV
ncbi:hypothetical protein HK102_005738 [Quaeritorhiza haematococci]|nr:hypothetical protein HK102_005738 [Quaeritorhiza haematococci]